MDPENWDFKFLCFLQLSLSIGGVLFSFSNYILGLIW